MANSKEILSTNIKNLLKMRGYSRQQLADKIDVKYTTLCDWTKGRTYPKMEYIVKMADALSVRTYALTDENPNYEKAYSEVFEEDFNTDNHQIAVYRYENNKLVLHCIDTFPGNWLDELDKANEKCEYIGLKLPDNTMDPKYLKGDIIIADNSGYTSDGDYLVRNIKSEKLALRSISIGNDIVCMFPLNPNNEIRDITRYVSKEDFYSKYEIIGKVKRLIRDF